MSTWRAAGTRAVGTGAVTPGMPTGYQAGDLLLCHVKTQNQRAATPAPTTTTGTWAEVTGSPQGTGTSGSGGTGTELWWKWAVATEDVTTVPDSGAYTAAIIHAFYGVANDGSNPWDVTAGDVDATSDTSGSATEVTTTHDGETVAVFVVNGADIATAQYGGGFTNANLTGLTTRGTISNWTTQGGGGMAACTGVKTSAGATGATTWTQVTASLKAFITVALRDPVPETSPALELSGFGTFTGVGSGDTINHVTVTVCQYASSALITAPTYELWDGTSARIGAAQAGAVSTTSTHTDTFDITGVTYAQLSGLRLRIYGNASTGSGLVQYVDWATLSVSYTPGAATVSGDVAVAVSAAAAAAGGVPVARAAVTRAPQLPPRPVAYASPQVISGPAVAIPGEVSGAVACPVTAAPASAGRTDPAGAAPNPVSAAAAAAGVTIRAAAASPAALTATVAAAGRTDPAGAAPVPVTAAPAAAGRTDPAGTTPVPVTAAAGTLTGIGGITGPAALTATVTAAGGTTTASIAGLADTFPGTTLNSGLWGSYGSVTIAGGIVTLTDIAATGNYTAIYSNSYYDLTGSHLQALLVTAGANQATSQSVLKLQDASGDNVLQLLAGSGNLVAQVTVATVQTTPYSAAYDAATMRWLRISEAGGTTYFQYSADGLSWTTAYSAVNPIPVTALQANLMQGQWGGADPQTSSQWAMVNPQAPVLLATLDGLTSLGPYNLMVNEYNSTDALVVTSSGATGPADYAVPVSALDVAGGGAAGAGPSLYYGNHWGTVTAGCALPVPVTALGGGTVKTSWAFDVSAIAAGGLWDVSYDIWFNASSSGNQSGSSADNLELMVWLNKTPAAGPAGTLVASGVTVAGATWDVWYGTGGNGPCASYVRTTLVTSVTDLDVGLFSADLVVRGYLSTAWYLIDIEAGFELWSGGAGFATTAFSVTAAPGITGDVAVAVTAAPAAAGVTGRPGDAAVPVTAAPAASGTVTVQAPADPCALTCTAGAAGAVVPHGATGGDATLPVTAAANLAGVTSRPGDSPVPVAAAAAAEGVTVRAAGADPCAVTVTPAAAGSVTPHGTTGGDEATPVAAGITAAGAAGHPAPSDACALSCAVTAEGLTVRPGTATAGVTAALTADGTATHPATATAALTATVAADGFTGSGALGDVARPVTAAPAATGALTLPGDPAATQAAAAITTAGITTRNDSQAVPVTMAVTAAGSVTAHGTWSGDQAIPVTTAVTAAGTITTPGAAPRPVTATVTPAGGLVWPGTATRPVSATVAVSGTVGAISAVPVTATPAAAGLVTRVVAVTVTLAATPATAGQGIHPAETTLTLTWTAGQARIGLLLSGQAAIAAAAEITAAAVAGMPTDLILAGIAARPPATTWTAGPPRTAWTAAPPRG